MYINEYHFNKSFKAHDGFDSFCKIEGLDPNYVKAYACLKGEGSPKAEKRNKNNMKLFKSMFSH